MKRAVWFLLASLLMTCTMNRSGQVNSQDTATTNNLEEHAKVTLYVFSGRENPSWQLSPEQTKTLISILDALPSSEPKSFFEGLGYQGFLVSLTDSASGESKIIRVYKGLVQYNTGSVEKYLTDKDRKIEHLLLESGGSRLESGIYNAVERELKPPHP